MIEAKDLRIGNLVKESKFSSRGRALQEYFQVDITDFKYSQFLEPIPLTEEWLKKFGFENHSPYFVHPEFDYQVRMQSNGDIIAFHEQLSEFYGFEIKYVHILQNFFHSVKGEELKLKQ
jgi:hypothetical protein